MEPLFSAYWPDALPECAAALRTVIALAEDRAARFVGVQAPTMEVRAALRKCVRTCASEGFVGPYFAADAVYATACALEADAQTSNVADQGTRVVAHVADAVRFAVSAASGIPSASEAHAEQMIKAVERDLGLILHRSRQERWTDESPVLPGLFETFWPGGPPTGWPMLDDADDGRHKRNPSPNPRTIRPRGAGHHTGDNLA